MSTIPSASPRPSISSRRTSTSTTDPSGSTADRSTFRRNKAAALRDYYGIRAGQPADTPPKVSLEVEQESEIDRPSFSAPEYAEKLLKQQDLAGILKTESVLVREIWGLDGERKALVYDNYSKLIGATETIKNMRERMENRRMETSTLTPAIGHIAETASTLSEGLFEKSSAAQMTDAEKKRRDQQATVKWVLSTPETLSNLLEQGQRGEAERQWAEVAPILDKWNGVKGVENLRKSCLAALDTSEASLGNG